MMLVPEGMHGHNRLDHARTALSVIVQRLDPQISKENVNPYTSTTGIRLYSDEKLDVEKIFENEFTDAIETVSLSPDWLKVSDALAYWKNSFDGFMENTSLSNVFNEICLSKLSYDQQIEMITTTTKMLQEYLIKSYEQWTKTSMIEFLNSDLPLELYNLYSFSYVSKITVLQKITDLINNFSRDVYVVRGDERKMLRKFLHFKDRLEEINDHMQTTYRSELVLRLFLKCISGEKTSDLFTLIPLTISNHKDKFETYLTEFRDNIYRFVQFLDADFSKQRKLLKHPTSNNFKEDIQTIIVNAAQY